MVERNLKSSKNEKIFEKINFNFFNLAKFIKFHELPKFQKLGEKNQKITLKNHIEKSH